MNYLLSLLPYFFGRLSSLCQFDICEIQKNFIKDIIGFSLEEFFCDFFCLPLDFAFLGFEEGLSCSKFVFVLLKLRKVHICCFELRNFLTCVRVVDVYISDKLARNHRFYFKEERCSAFLVRDIDFFQNGRVCDKADEFLNSPQVKTVAFHLKLLQRDQSIAAI